MCLKLNDETLHGQKYMDTSGLWPHVIAEHLIQKPSAATTASTPLKGFPPDLGTWLNPYAPINHKYRCWAIKTGWQLCFTLSFHIERGSFCEATPK